MAILKQGGDTLDAVIAAVTVVESPTRHLSRLRRILPNERRRRSTQLQRTDRPCAPDRSRRYATSRTSRDSKTVMENTNHVMIVGDGARRYAVDEGFEEMNLLTHNSRKIWHAWKASSSMNWRPGIDSPERKEHMTKLFDGDEKEIAVAERVIAHPPWGTIPCMAINEKGDISATTTTSGLAWKIAGRVGDSPIIGAGCCVDNEVGAAGSTGKGEENIKISGGHTIIEQMRQENLKGCMSRSAVARIAHSAIRTTKEAEHIFIFFYAINKDSVHGAASLWKNTYDRSKHSTYAVHDGTEAKLMDCAPFFEEMGGDE